MAIKILGLSLLLCVVELNKNDTSWKTSVKDKGKYVNNSLNNYTRIYFDKMYEIVSHTLQIYRA